MIEQETSTKVKEAESTKTGIKTEAKEIKEENQLMNLEDVDKTIGTMIRYF